jgi:hypothetical protein
MLDQLGSGPLPTPPETLPPRDDPELVTALLSGGDGRLSVHPVTGLNKYLCPPVPASGVLCAASCTASPITAAGFDMAARCLRDITAAPSPAGRAARVAEHAWDLRGRLLRHYGVEGLASAALCPSGTDAILLASLTLAAERPDAPHTMILPSATETGTGVPLAAGGRRFDGPEAGIALTDTPITTVEIPTRSPDGAPRPDAALDAAYAEAARAAPGRAIVVLTHASKTGLIAPAGLPEGADVLVDACQSRIEPATVAAYLRRGWPVALTGSKFFGGPAFSGAVLLPRDRFAAPAATETLGTVLRWTSAMITIEAFGRRAEGMGALLRTCGAAIGRALAANPSLVPIGGLMPRGPGWADLPSIFTFAVRDPGPSGHLLSVTELRPLYERLARDGILLGQPVGFGRFGGLRVAIGARDLLEGTGAGDGMARLLNTLASLDPLAGAGRA